MTQSTEQERAEFEQMRNAFEESSRHKEWLVSQREGIGYRGGATHDAWVRWQKAWQAARRAQVVPQSEPVAYLWQHGETGRTRVVMPDTVITADANWIVVGPLYLAAAPQPPEADIGNPISNENQQVAEAAPVQMPEPVAVAFRFETEENGPTETSFYPSERIGMGMGWTALHTEHQVRELLASK